MTDVLLRWAPGFLAGLLSGLLLGTLVDWRAVWEAGAMRRHALLRRVSWLRSLGFVMLLAGVALVLSGTAVWLNGQSTPRHEFNAYVECRARWDTLLSNVYSKRATAMDQMVRSIAADGAFDVAAQNYQAIADRYPPPPDPVDVCGKPPSSP